MFEARKTRENITIDGVPVPIDTDFRIMCEYSVNLAKHDPERLSKVASRFFFAGLPAGVDVKAAAEAMVDFFSEGLGVDRQHYEEKGSSSAGKAPDFDFEEDEGFFVAAFLSEYGIDLTTVKMHWFTFCALFRGLPDECKLKKIIGIRSTNIANITSTTERKRIKALKRAYALKRSKAPVYKTVAERDEHMKQELLNRLAQINQKRGE